MALSFFSPQRNDDDLPSSSSSSPYRSLPRRVGHGHGCAESDSENKLQLGHDRLANDVQHLTITNIDPSSPETTGSFSWPSSAGPEQPLLHSVVGEGDYHVDGVSISPSFPRSLIWRARLWALWLQNKGMVLVMLSQFFGASMNVMTQILEVNGSHGPAMDPFQILFARMSITVAASYLYMWYAKVKHPFGTRPVLGLLVMRAACGFFGVYGLYYSVQYMALSEATVLTFLSPILSCYACSFFMAGETFTRQQQIAGLASLLGVVLIARPFTSSGAPGEVDPTPPDEASASGGEPNSADVYHHVLAIGIALIGVLGASFAYMAIRIIGKRAHPLVSVTYFSAWTLIISTVALVAVPSVPFRLPRSLEEWGLLLGLGICGFILQFLLTAGLSYVPPPPPGAKASAHGSRATFMLYTQMLFALLYDKVIWGSTLSPLSWAGSCLILGCAVYVTVVQDGSPSQQDEQTAGEGYKDDIPGEHRLEGRE